MIYQTLSTDSAATEALGERLGQVCRGNEVIELISDLGGGKTTFVRGLARGLGSKDSVASPTFTIVREYQGRLKLYHFDFYRLHDAGVVGSELAEVIHDHDGVVAIEWGEVVHDILPDKRIRITFSKRGDDDRDIIVEYPEEWDYIGKSLEAS